MDAVQVTRKKRTLNAKQCVLNHSHDDTMKIKQSNMKNDLRSLKRAAEQKKLHGKCVHKDDRICVIERMCV